MSNMSEDERWNIFTTFYNIRNGDNPEDYDSNDIQKIYDDFRMIDAIVGRSPDRVPTIVSDLLILYFGDDDFISLKSEIKDTLVEFSKLVKRR